MWCSLDDLHLIVDVVDSGNYPRANLLDAALAALVADAGSRNKKLLFAVQDHAPWPVRRRAYSWRIGGFKAADYENICRDYMGAIRTCNEKKKR